MYHYHFVILLEWDPDPAASAHRLSLSQMRPLPLYLPSGLWTPPAKVDGTDKVVQCHVMYRKVRLWSLSSFLVGPDFLLRAILHPPLLFRLALFLSLFSFPFCLLDPGFRPYYTFTSIIAPASCMVGLFVLYAALPLM